MTVRLAIFSNIDGIKDEYRKDIARKIESSTSIATEFTVLESDRKGWHVLTDDLELGDRDIEVRSLGCGAGVFAPYTNEMYVVPVEWVKSDTLQCVRTLIVPVEDERANKPFEKYVEQAYSKTYYYMGGIEMFREVYDEDYDG